jgi:hypothetical protein
MSVNEMIVKARRVGNSIVLTSPYAEEGRSYYITQTNNGIIVYHPVKTLGETRESNVGNRNMTLGQFTTSNPSGYRPEYERGEF